MSTSRWIPVSERLPDKDGFFLVTINAGKEPYIRTCCYVWITNRFAWRPQSEVIAWMSLPEPYLPQEAHP